MYSSTLSSSVCSSQATPLLLTCRQGRWAGRRSSGDSQLLAPLLSGAGRLQPARRLGPTTALTEL